ncbi:hypothetical protein [Teredinibacter turnerae]|uniref:hypothetical protein n=1 Tax=Teredinibacter turnerae TaxID=2426 RepID=UPI001E5D290F|nr:hypothetical protein [Teredinibacter turnerae]
MRTMEVNFPVENDYLQIIAEFPRYANRGWRKATIAGVDHHYFADGSSGENGIRTNANFVFTAAFLADELGNNDMFEKAAQAIAYLIQGHLTGTGHCVDGKQWGAHWQSAWWANKLVQGAKLIWARLTDEARAGVNKVLVFEADRHLERLVPSGTFLDTKAEENAWDAEILAAACSHLPEHPNAAQWRAKAIEFNFNTLSVAHDTRDESLVDGAAVKDNVYTCNLHSDFTIENHGASHFCYIASPLLSVTWSFYSYTSAGQVPPAALFHHVNDFWQLSKSTFLDSRFAYIGGKDWARYTYGLYFIVPALVMLQSQFADADARYIEQSRVRTLADEHTDNADGSFFGKRVTHNIFRGQPPKYESDCYTTLALAYLLHKSLATTKQAPTADEFRRSTARRHSSPESSTNFIANANFFSSFSWRTLEGYDPIALFVPRGCDDMAEWSANNLVGYVRPVPDNFSIGIRSSKVEDTDGSVYINGVTATRNEKQNFYDHHLDVALQTESVRIHSRLKIKSDFMVSESGAIALALVNDWFNDFTRTIYHEGGEQNLTFDLERDFPFAGLLKGKPYKAYRKLCRYFGIGNNQYEFDSNWLNIDNKFGIIRLSKNQNGFFINDPIGRNTRGKCLHYATIYGGKPSLRRHKVRKGQIVFDETVLLIAATAEETRQKAKELIDS